MYNQPTHLLFPIITPTRSPLPTPSPTSPRASARTCASSSPKSHRRHPSPPDRGEGPPCGRARSPRATSAGRAPCGRRMLSRKYAGRVFVTSGGWEGPSTSERASCVVDVESRRPWKEGGLGVVGPSLRAGGRRRREFKVLALCMACLLVSSRSRGGGKRGDEIKIAGYRGWCATLCTPHDAKALITRERAKRHGWCAGDRGTPGGHHSSNRNTQHGATGGGVAVGQWRSSRAEVLGYGIRT